MESDNEDIVAEAGEEMEATAEEVVVEEKKEEKKINASNEGLTITDDNDAEEEKEEENVNREDPLKPLNVSSSENESESQLENQPSEEEAQWIKDKVAYYSRLSDEGQIENYQRDTSESEGLSVEFNGAKIHYSSPTDVSVSPDASYKVFDVMLNEPDNKGRPVNFSESMKPEMAARLYAACILNGNKVIGNVPQLTDEMKTQLKAEMGNDAYAQFEEKLSARTLNEQEQSSAQQSNENADLVAESLNRVRGKIHNRQGNTTDNEVQPDRNSNNVMMTRGSSRDGR
ncbi:MAG: hypothetical protein MJ212_00060 [Alphaproteobacteria bacterium]|nr:hypothetical protein [Alphaproteobacteria bacterium]